MNHVLKIISFLMISLFSASQAGDGFVAFGYGNNGAEFYAITVDGNVYNLSTSSGINSFCFNLAVSENSNAL